MKIVVCFSYVDDNPKGIMTVKQFENLSNKNWISKKIIVEVPDDEIDALHIGNIKNYY